MIPYDVLSVKPIVFSTFSHVYFDTETICESYKIIAEECKIYKLNVNKGAEIIRPRQVIRCIQFRIGLERGQKKRERRERTTGFRWEVRSRTCDVIKNSRLETDEESRAGVSVEVKRLDAKNSRVLSTRRFVSIYKRQIYRGVYTCRNVLTHHFDLVYLRDVSPRRWSDCLAHIRPAILPLDVVDPQAAVAIQGDSFGRPLLLLPEAAFGQKDLIPPPSHPTSKFRLRSAKVTLGRICGQGHIRPMR
ncbi:hypothetical protein ALC56_07335 [Trachymyrmex septentrionalis]|uniref:Uncharacterized protein n=1 Tax=Trachymyrmex septentrionalis TaxID=34720 RepID=A0A195FCD3_9HYME|nr:hypothetical protein ALC56_07335 [Trachymyrmex septentrionalis]